MQGVIWKFPKSWIIDIMNDHELIWGYPPNQVILEHFSIANALMIECLNMPHTPKIAILNWAHGFGWIWGKGFSDMWPMCPHPFVTWMSWDQGKPFHDKRIFSVVVKVYRSYTRAIPFLYHAGDALYQFKRCTVVYHI